MFRRGKGAKLRGRPYVVYTAKLPTFMIQPIKTYLDTFPHLTSPLFAITPAKMLPIFRLADKRMEARSIRRGTLQTMAQLKVPIDVLLMYSGHSCEKTLWRYLNYGHDYALMAQRMSTAGEALIEQDQDSDTDSETDEPTKLQC